MATTSQVAVPFWPQIYRAQEGLCMNISHQIDFASLFNWSNFDNCFLEDVVQDTTVLVKGSWRFLNSVHLYRNAEKNTLATALLLMLPWFGIIYLMRSILPQLLPVSEKSQYHIFSKRLSQLSIHSIQRLCGIGLSNSFVMTIF